MNFRAILDEQSAAAERVMSERQKAELAAKEETQAQERALGAQARKAERKKEKEERQRLASLVVATPPPPNVFELLRQSSEETTQCHAA